MPSLPKKEEQIVQAHAGLIHSVVMVCHNRNLLPELESVLQTTAANGWTALVSAVRKVLAGRRDHDLLSGLDEDDKVIIEAILRGLQDPSSLPDPGKQPDPVMAAPGLALMIDAASKGNIDALQLVAHMAEQMTRVGGDMARLGGTVNRLINGERQADELCRGMGLKGRSLVRSILEELGKLNAH
jgi:hypothetical protein